jgi:hypothetical protein
MLLKNPGALSEYAKCSKVKKKLKSLLSILDTMEWSKKLSHATVPLSSSSASLFLSISSLSGQSVCMIPIYCLFYPFAYCKSPFLGPSTPSPRSFYVCLKCKFLSRISCFQTFFPFVSLIPAKACLFLC